MGLSNSCARAADRVVAATDRGFVEDEDEVEVEVETEEEEEEEEEDREGDSAGDGLTPA